MLRKNDIRQVISFNNRLLGSLINAPVFSEKVHEIFPQVYPFNHKGDRYFDVSLFSSLSFVANTNSSEDMQAREYLSDVLLEFSDNNVDFFVSTVSSDGSCLPHALSISIFGTELYFDAFRACLVNELTENEEWYRKNTQLGRCLDDEDWNIQFKKLLLSAQPTRGRLVDSEYYLEGFHILAFANLLRRPILLLDKEASIDSSTCLGLDGSGLYLPLRHSRSDIIEYHGRVIPPIVLGWASCSRNHYVVLLRVRRTLELIIHDGPCYQEWINLVKEVELYDDLTYCIRKLCRYNSVCVRDASVKVLLVYIRSISKYFDRPIPENEKFLSINMNNSGFKYSILQVPGALETLLASGFTKPDEEDKLVFPRNEYHRCTERSIIITALKYFEEFGGPLFKIPYLFYDDLSVEQGKQLFGKFPLGLYNFESCHPSSQDANNKLEFGCINELNRDDNELSEKIWLHAVRLYGEGSQKEGSCWTLTLGNEKEDLQQIDKYIRNQLIPFYDICMKNYGGIEMLQASWNTKDFAAMYCPVCDSHYYWLESDDPRTLEMECLHDMSRTMVCNCGEKVFSVRDTLLYKIFSKISDLYDLRVDYC